MLRMTKDEWKRVSLPASGQIPTASGDRHLYRCQRLYRTCRLFRSDPAGLLPGARTPSVKGARAGRCHRPELSAGQIFCFSSLTLRLLRYVPEALLDPPPGQEQKPAAARAFQADVGAGADHFEAVHPAGMSLFQCEDIALVQNDHHGSSLSGRGNVCAAVRWLRRRPGRSGLPSRRGAKRRSQGLRSRS